jgi:hypothetical protein
MTLFVYGLDPAERTDYFGIVINSINGPTAKLHTLRKIRDFKYPDVIRLLKFDLFVRYPPYRIVIDYSNEKTFSETLIEQYGKEVVEAINFTNANKMMLKKDGLQVLQMGYEWPTSQDPKVQSWIDELRDQLKHEQMLETPSGKLSFDHPQGEHNDLAIAWELSIHGCLPFILQSRGPPVIVSAEVNDFDTWQLEQDPYGKFKANIRKRASNLGLGVTVTDITLDGDRI